MKHVTFHLPSFLRRVRIHGGEFDSSARAMNRVSEKGSLMTYERPFTAQAEPRIVRGSTIERKQMSTKTTIKRIALVSVAALGFGVLSVVPSTAVTNADSLTVSATTAAQTTAETATATSATATLAFLSGAVTDSMSVTASLVSGPATSTALPYLQVVETTTAQIGNGNLTPLAAGTGVVEPNKAGIVFQTGSTVPAAVSAKVRVYLGTTATAAPSVAGTYVVRLTPAVTAGGGSLNATAQTITITVTTAATQSTTVDATTSTSILNTGETNTATADATVSGSMTVPAGGNTEAVGTIAVVLKNTAGTTLSGESYTAVIVSGPGLLGSGAAAAGTSFAGNGRAIAVQHNHVVGVFPDGTSGVAKIEIRTAAGVVIATETVTFFGAIASIVATVVKPVIAVGAATGVITAVAKDAAGTTITAPTLFITSSDLTVVNASGAAAATSAAGVATFGFTGLKAGTANFTVGNAATAATVSAAAVSVRVGSSTPASITVSLDKASYAPGEAVTASIAVLDATGLAVADGVYNNIFATGGISANYSLGASWLDTTTVTTVGGVGTRTGFLPSTEGDVTFKWTTGTNLATANQGVAGTPIVVSVSSPAAAAATDAANEARDAADAATDAALQAAEAADAATVAAQEASDAVAALSESVTALVAGLQAQIKSLAAVLARIAKKVKA